MSASAALAQAPQGRAARMARGGAAQAQARARSDLRAHTARRLPGETVSEWHQRSMRLWFDQMRGLMGVDQARQLRDAVASHHELRRREL